ncbi:hypothetical protein TELCIR_01875 [Teladorsagia circumcincta]|uniref:Uncharacterized protein n=1 Tax=Teladorsagia circumcincta TaxID=45464 RepID=A0A2G9V2X0_TELCI|nr:hypothetical protein TELCIR_01875 [Teladorsagia circumcincta]
MGSFGNWFKSSTSNKELNGIYAITRLGEDKLKKDDKSNKLCFPGRTLTYEKREENIYRTMPKGCQRDISAVSCNVFASVAMPSVHMDGCYIGMFHHFGYGDHFDHDHMGHDLGTQVFLMTSAIMAALLDITIMTNTTGTTTETISTITMITTEIILAIMETTITAITFMNTMDLTILETILVTIITDTIMNSVITTTLVITETMASMIISVIMDSIITTITLMDITHSIFITESPVMESLPQQSLHVYLPYRINRTLNTRRHSYEFLASSYLFSGKTCPPSLNDGIVAILVHYHKCSFIGIGEVWEKLLKTIKVEEKIAPIPMIKLSQ